jgi:hypothetical protein
VSKKVLRRRSVSSLGNGVQHQDQEQLYAVRDEYLPLVSKNYVVIWHAPCGGVVLEGLPGSACAGV